MAVVMVDGFDTYNGTGVTPGVQAKWTTGGATTTLVTGRFGGQALSVQSVTNTVASQWKRGLAVAASAYSWGGAIKATGMTNLNASSVNNIIMATQSAATWMIGLGLNQNGSITVYRMTAANTGVALGTTPVGLILEAQWHHVECAITISDTVGTVDVGIDGVNVLSLTAQDTRNGAPTNIDTLAMPRLINNATNTATVAYDDFHFSDTAVLLGDRRVETLYPTSDVAQGFARSAGAVNYTLVDEAIVNGDTDYVQGSIVGDLDTYGFGDLSTTPLNVTAVQLSAFALKTDAVARSIALQAKSGASTTDGASFGLATTYGKHERLMLVDPNTSAAWTAAAVNALTGGPKVTV